MSTQEQAKVARYSVNLTIKELCDVVEGVSSLDPSFLVASIASLESAQEKDLAIVFDPEDNSVFPPLSLHKIKASNAGVILASKPVVTDKAYVIVKDPLMAFEKLAAFLEQKKYGHVRTVDPLAAVGTFAVI